MNHHQSSCITRYFNISVEYDETPYKVPNGERFHICRIRIDGIGLTQVHMSQMGHVLQEGVDFITD
jgi:hypothetical protein